MVWIGSIARGCMGHSRHQPVADCGLPECRCGDDKPARRQLMSTVVRFQKIQQDTNRRTGGGSTLRQQAISIDASFRLQHENNTGSDKLLAMVWRRCTALLVMLVLPLAGTWILFACAGEANDPDSDSAAGDYCTIICHAQGHYCPVHDQGQQESCTCNMSGAPPNVAVAGGLVSGVVQNPFRLAVTIESAPALLLTIATPATVTVESPTPPPKLSV